MEQNKKDGDPGCHIGNRTPNAPFTPPRPVIKNDFSFFPVSTVQTKGSTYFRLKWDGLDH